jgi:hypothetical protein
MKKCDHVPDADLLTNPKWPRDDKGKPVREAQPFRFRSRCLGSYQDEPDAWRKQPLLRDGWDHNRDLPQPTVFSQNHPDMTLRGKAKGIQQVLRERGLWRDHCADGSKFRLICPKTHDRPGCDPALGGECCATALLQSQRDFQEQKGWLQKEVEAADHSCIQVNIHSHYKPRLKALPQDN